MKNIPIRQINTSQAEHNISENFNIRDIKFLLKGKDMIQEVHRHDFFFILALKKGKGLHEIDFMPYKVSDNSVFFMRPGQVHQLDLKKESIGYVMEFKTDFYHPNDIESNQVLTKVSNKNLCQLDSNKLKKLFSVLEYILEEYNEKKEGYQEVIKANLGIFFIELLRHRQNKSKPSDAINAYTQEQLDKLITLLEKNIFQYKQVSQYAELLNLSTYQLNSITKSSLGKTCSDLINEQILLESKRQLLATSNQVNQIAYHLGYEDVSYFIRFFKKHTGYTPDAFRQNFK